MHKPGRRTHSRGKRWENGTLRFRDIHIFDENLVSDYLTEKGINSDCNYYTLPFVDGFQWSSADLIAGLRFKTVSNDSIIEIKGEDPAVDDNVEKQLTVRWPLLNNSGEIKMIFNESSVSITTKGGQLENWFLELSHAEGKELPFETIKKKQINCNYGGFKYSVLENSGTFVKEIDTKMRIIPDIDGIIIDFSTNE
jgi:hypothetical protein